MRTSCGHEDTTARTGQKDKTQGWATTTYEIAKATTISIDMATLRGCICAAADSFRGRTNDDPKTETPPGIRARRDSSHTWLRPRQVSNESHHQVPSVRPEQMGQTQYFGHLHDEYPDQMPYQHLVNAIVFSVKT